jgi:hypothetical protein
MPQVPPTLQEDPPWRLFEFPDPATREANVETLRRSEALPQFGQRTSGMAECRLTNSSNGLPQVSQTNS